MGRKPHKSNTRPGITSGLARWASAGLIALCLVATPQLSAAQGTETKMSSPVLTLDFEKLFEQTTWGKRIRAELAQDSRALSNENNQIADSLVEEEKALTERRPTLAPEEFRKLADAFDERATSIRNAQKAKAQALSQKFDDDRQAFFTAAAPLLDQVLAKHNAAVVLDRRVIIRSLAQTDITNDLVALMDAQLGDGSKVEAAPATPEQAPAPVAPVLPEATPPEISTPGN